MLLTGDFTIAGAANGANFLAKVRVTPGAAGPAAKGVATASAHVRKHVLKQNLTLNAKGAPAGQMLTIKINGTVTGQVKATARGRVSVKGLPQGLSAHKVSTISLENSSGIRVLSAHF